MDVICYETWDLAEVQIAMHSLTKACGGPRSLSIIVRYDLCSTVVKDTAKRMLSSAFLKHRCFR